MLGRLKPINVDAKTLKSNMLVVAKKQDPEAQEAFTPVIVILLE